MPVRPRLLYIAPLMPADAGNGLAMRAGLFLDAFARRYDVTLLVVPVSGLADERAVPAWVRARAREVLVQPVVWDDRLDAVYRSVLKIRGQERPSGPAVDDLLAGIRALKRSRARTPEPESRPRPARHATEEAVRQAAQRVAHRSYDVVHVMRLYIAPYAEPYLTATGPTQPLCVLDLDDDESTKFARVSALRRRDPSDTLAEAAALDGVGFAAMEREYLARFDAVTVCSEADAETLANRHGLDNLRVVPNGVRIPATPGPEPAVADFDCLFVGSFDYYPNQDGARFFCREILPALRVGDHATATLGLVGRGVPTALVREIAETPGAICVGEVGDVTPFYRVSRLAVVPLRAGGGTRIKILEAFAHARPVVSTSLGAEGLAVEPGTHLLLADTPAGFADACRILVDDGPLRARMSAAASELVRTRYSVPVVTERILAMYDELAGR